MDGSAVPPRVAPGHTRRSRRASVVPGHILTVMLHASLLLVLLGMAVPFAYMIAGSFKSNSDIFGNPLRLLPSIPTMQNFVDLLNGSQIPYQQQYANSLIVGVCTTLLTLAVASLTGYGFAKFDFRFKRALFIVVLATLTIPMQITLVPLFLLMHSFSWLDNLKAVIVPGAFSAFGVFLMRQTMLGVPAELLDAARIDGSSEFGLFLRIALPLSRAGLTVLSILVFLNSWNDFLWPIIVLQSNSNMTIPVGLASLNGLYHVRYGMIDAGASLSALPIIVLFIVLRKQFLSGLTAGALKGM